MPDHDTYQGGQFSTLFSPIPWTFFHAVLQLLDRLTFDASSSMEEQLDKIIVSTTGLEYWRQVFVQVPAAIEYCGQRAIRRYSPEQIYLLKKSQMNGAHVELFTYGLYQTLSANRNQSQPLRLGHYEDVSETDIEPYIVMFLSQKDFSANVKVYFINGHFVIRIDTKQVENHPEILTKLCSFGFQHDALLLSKIATHIEVEKTLNALSNTFLISPDNEVNNV